MSNVIAKRRRLLCAAGLVAVLAVVIGVYVWTRRGTTHPTKPAALPTAQPGKQPSARPSVSSPPRTPSPGATPPKPHGPPHERVRPSVPTSFTMTGAKFTIRAHVCAMAPVFPLDPPGEQHHTVCWVTKGFGVEPGSRSATSYVLGHSWAPDSQEVLNKLSEPATKEILRAQPKLRSGMKTYPVHALTGYKLILKTATGTLTYKVRDAYGVGKLDLGHVKSALNQHIRNRVVLITCAELNGTDYDYNVIVEAYLYSSVRAVPSKA